MLVAKDSFELSRISEAQDAGFLEVDDENLARGTHSHAIGKMHVKIEFIVQTLEFNGMLDPCARAHVKLLRNFTKWSTTHQVICPFGFENTNIALKICRDGITFFRHLPRPFCRYRRCKVFSDHVLHVINNVNFIHRETCTKSNDGQIPLHAIIPHYLVQKLVLAKVE
jgi:hypothetical protein